jgi:hypothetical protein
MTQCAACHRNALANNRYCIHHAQALQSMTDHYKAWVEAYGRISWDDFLNKLLKMQETGSWIKEVIEVELKEKS